VTNRLSYGTALKPGGSPGLISVQDSQGQTQVTESDPERNISRFLIFLLGARMVEFS
jgi:hypothetical protein